MGEDGLESTGSERVAGRAPLGEPVSASTGVTGVERPRQIPSLDGLRALSVTLVLALHTLQRFSATHYVGTYWYVLTNGTMGVFIFFIISGFLITTLMLREEDKRGSISLRSFYLRRAFRILPPMYVYVAFVAILWWAGHMPGITRKDLWTAATFIANYTNANGWALEHFWSLCIEEQFYLVWPGVLVWCLWKRPGWEGRKLAARIALGVIVVEPFIRLATYRFAHGSLNAAKFHLQADPLMFGALGALLQHRSATFERVYRAATRIPWILPTVLFTGLALLDARFANYWHLPLGITLEGFVVLMWLLWLTRHPHSLQGRFFNQPVVMWVGRLSYSIYLWQTFFLHPDNESVFHGPHPWNTPPLNWVCVLVVATMSFYLVEQPSLKLRDRFLRRIGWHEI